jgi:hypothetical protein
LSWLLLLARLALILARFIVTRLYPAADHDITDD